MTVIRFPRPTEHRGRDLSSDVIGDELIELAHRLAHLGQKIGDQPELAQTTKLNMLASLCTANVQIKDVAMTYVKARKVDRAP
ncbi:hypothetical protein E8L99_07175 [Phreatobacter aquaticus]|uniref:Uncharacterized protein n=1 Tax=Phreatobacter aquaticus TaxID=2570229 RepID=A0A4D7QJM3_9HYPH|nr:hypothetical protein [Phreatobacter aquaticus]QCK85564.1 hypothetical protein E8L99_07175 [Phreatobacter aquaticus]